MTDFLIKSTLCMTVLLSGYHLLLKKEKMHQFNRFYLLAALTLSFAAPFITIKIVSEALSLPVSLPAIPFKDAMTTPSEALHPQQFNYPIAAAWSLYSIVTLILFIRFALHIHHFIAKIRNNTHIQYGRATLVLVNEPILPHTFLNYIFLNNEAYQDNAIENELYTHELTHVTQKHTLDILFIETLKAFFWFNPLLYAYKKAIQLNHEFLADEKVISSYNNAAFYQRLLLEKAKVSYTLNLASNLTYSLTKQRLVMMTKSTSVFKSALLKTVLVPVMLAGIFLLVSLKKVENAATGAFTGKSPSEEQWNQWKNDANTVIFINNQEIKKADLNKYNVSDLVSYSENFVQTQATADNPQHQVFLYTQKGFEDHYNSLERPRPIEYKELLKLRRKDDC